ncbi:hypothetical protein [Halobacteriovorax sp. RZ-2]|uniref:hypothetical protein n=1 Tax=unclassified Halobacteriovorax TaxID=2639665 RepID=UPI0037238917
MTKKKGFFSKIKSKLSKEQDDSEFIEHEETLHDGEEYEEEYEGDEGEVYEEDVDIPLPPPPTAQLDNHQEEDQDEHQEDDNVLEDPTLEVYIDDLEAHSEEDAGFLSKLKSKLSNKSKDDTEDEDSEEFSDDEEDELEAESGNKYNVMQRMLDKIKSKTEDFDLSKVGAGKRGKGHQSGAQYFLPNLLSNESRPKIHHYFLILLTCAFLYQIGKFAALFLSGKDSSAKFQTNFSRPTTYDHNPSIANIRNYNPFNIQEDENEKTETKVKRPKNVVKVCLSADQESRLGFKLLNTIVLQNTKKSVASVSNRGKVENVRVGGKINNIAEIGSITRQKVIFKNLRTGECEFIANVDEKAKRFARKANTKILPPSRAKEVMPEFNKDIKVEGNNFKIKKELRDSLLSNIGDVLTQAKAITIKNPDGSLCFKMTEVKPGSIYSYLNVQNDDIICEINGAKIENMNQIMGMFGKIKSTDYYELGIKRNGVQQSYNYNFVE